MHCEQPLSLPPSSPLCKLSRSKDQAHKHCGEFRSDHNLLFGIKLLAMRYQKLGLYGCSAIRFGAPTDPPFLVSVELVLIPVLIATTSPHPPNPAHRVLSRATYLL